MTPQQQATIIAQINAPYPPRRLSQAAIDRCKVDPEFKAKLKAASWARLERQRALADAQMRAFVETLHDNPAKRLLRRIKRLFN